MIRKKSVPVHFFFFYWFLKINSNLSRRNNYCPVLHTICHNIIIVCAMTAAAIVKVIGRDFMAGIVHYNIAIPHERIVVVDA